MANPEHLAKLKEGVMIWNEWRASNQGLAIDLRESDLSGLCLNGVHLSNSNLNAANLSGAQLQRAKLKRASLQDANLDGADLSDANLFLADLQGAKLIGAIARSAGLNQTNLVGAHLGHADLHAADLSKADLTGARLYSTNLSEANLSGAVVIRARLHNTNLSRADLNGVDLTAVDTPRLNSIDLSGAKLSRCFLNENILCNSALVGANLSGQDLHGYMLSSLNLSKTDLRGANLQGANLSNANLHEADLTEANLSCSNLQSASFNQSNLTDACLWETLRAGWSIAGVTCPRIFWDKGKQAAITYTPGEFEHLYSTQTTIELFYHKGISTFELSTLPALLQHLASKHPDTNIRLKTVEETGGGARITISLDNADEQTKVQAQADATELLQHQLALRHNEGRLQQLQDNFNGLLAYMTQTLIASAAPQNYFNAPVQNAFLASGNANQEIKQTFNDPTEIIQLIDRLLAGNPHLTRAQSEEVEAVKAQLTETNPDKSRLARSLDFLKTLPKEAVLKGVGKLGERAAETDWSSLVHQVSEFIHHLS